MNDVMIKQYKNPKALDANLESAQTFIRRRKQENLESGTIECMGLRQTGRTTRAVLQSLDNVRSKLRVLFVVHNSQMKKHVAEMFKHYSREVGVTINDNDVIIESIHELDNIRGGLYDVCVFDNCVTDIMVKGVK